MKPLTEYVRMRSEENNFTHEVRIIICQINLLGLTKDLGATEFIVKSFLVGLFNKSPEEEIILPKSNKKTWTLSFTLSWDAVTKTVVYYLSAASLTSLQVDFRQKKKERKEVKLISTQYGE